MNRIHSVSIKNFKSLLDVTIILPPTSPVTFLIGLNGSGKSTVLQALDFIGELARGDVAAWLKKRNWSPSDLATNIHSSKRKTLIEIIISGVLEGQEFLWMCLFNPSSNILRCTSESFTVNNNKIFTMKDGKLTLPDQEISVVTSYSGSIIPHLNMRSVNDELKTFKNMIASIRSFDMLSPRDIRGKSRKSDNIGMSGESLAGYIYNFDAQKKEELNKKLTKFYKWIIKSDIKSLQYGWKELRINERIGVYPHPTTNKPTRYYLSRSAQHANDGTLRLLAIIASLFSENSITLFDEIENGFNPHIIQDLVNVLYSHDRQIIVTTHSPEVLQYIPEEYIENSTKFLYRKTDGSTGIDNFFTNPDIKQKLEMLGPGEAFLDVDLEHLTERLG